MKRRLQDLTEAEMIITLDTLYTAASAIKGRAAVKLFLRDLLTPSERIMLGRRIIIARMLIAGESYDDIGKRLRVGQGTIVRVHRWLKDQFPGFEQAIKKMEKEFAARAQRMPLESFSYAWLKRKFPLHFLLFPKPKIEHQVGEYSQRLQK